MKVIEFGIIIICILGHVFKSQTVGSFSIYISLTFFEMHGCK